MAPPLAAVRQARLERAEPASLAVARLRLGRDEAVANGRERRCRARRLERARHEEVDGLVVLEAEASLAQDVREFGLVVCTTP